MTELDTDLLVTTRAARKAFLVAVEDHRPQLFAYCRRLAGSVWDAEDLVQETLAKAFAVAAQTHYPIEKPLPWLIRVATNTYIDQLRHVREYPGEAADRAGSQSPDPLEVRDALEEVVTMLSPQERAAFILKDVFGYPLADIAAMVGTTEGAVKSALSRGRGRLADEERRTRLSRNGRPSRALLDEVAEAFTSYDIARVTSLFLHDASSEVVGMVSEDGVEAIAGGSLAHTFSGDAACVFRAEVHDLYGEPVIVLFERPVDSSGADTGPERPSDLLRFTARDDRVATMRWYYFCPQVLTEVGAALGLTMKTNGYRYD